MRQILQSLSSGSVLLQDMPCPSPASFQLVIRGAVSLISSGTERMLVDFGKAGYLEKARQQPEKVKQVLDKMKTDGVGSTLQAVSSKLSEPIPLGYSSVGTVIAVGDGVTDFKVGDRVVSNGHHAEVVVVSENLAAHIPQQVDDEGFILITTYDHYRSSAQSVFYASIGFHSVAVREPEVDQSNVNLLFTGIVVQHLVHFAYRLGMVNKYAELSIRFVNS